MRSLFSHDKGKLVYLLIIYIICLICPVQTVFAQMSNCPPLDEKKPYFNLQMDSAIKVLPDPAISLHDIIQPTSEYRNQLLPYIAFVRNRPGLERPPNRCRLLAEETPSSETEATSSDTHESVEEPVPVQMEKSSRKFYDKWYVAAAVVGIVALAKYGLLEGGIDKELPEFPSPPGN